MKKYLLYWLFLVVIIVTAAYFAGKFLVLDATQKKSDVIAVLSGDRGERTEKGVELFKNGFAPYLLFSGGTVYNTITMAGLMKEHAVSLGVPESIIITEDKSDSTYENAVYTKSIMLEKGLKSAIIVSSNYHMRRVRLIFEREFKNSGITLNYVSANDRDFDPVNWWSNNKSIMLTINEYIKLLGYSLGKNS